MKTWTAVVVAVVIAIAAAGASAQQRAEDDRALRTRIEQRYDVVLLTDGIALRPKTRIADVRLIEISDTIVVNGVPVTGRELRDRIGPDADLILRVSYLDRAARRALFAPAAEPEQTRPQAEPPLEAPAAKPATPAAPLPPARMRRSTGDRVRIFGDVRVAEDEEIAGQVVAVIGSVSIDGEVGDQVVAVLGSVNLGPKALVLGDVVSVGGRVRRAEGAQVRGGVTEVAFADPDVHFRISPWMDGWWNGWRMHPFGPFGAVPRLIGSTFRLLLLALLASIALVVARGGVEGSAQRISDNPVKATVIGLLAGILIAPVLFLTTVVLAISIIGIPLLLLMPFVVLVLLLLALVGFSGTAYSVGQWTRRRFGMGTQPGFVDVCLGVVVILLPVLAARLIALAGWPVTPLAVLLLATGFGVEFLAWTTGFGAVLTNAFTRWQAHRAPQTTAPPPATP
ncbi:MAG TPA: hypothetical protein VLD67_03565 [Vicinamibacterales bacterium]|nr:hypothetical protein [Vicinamibacterales bacterium]